MYPLFILFIAALAAALLFFSIAWNGKIRNTSIEEAFQNEEPLHSYVEQLWSNLNDSEHDMFHKLEHTFERQKYPPWYLVLSPDGTVIECDVTTYLIWKLKKQTGNRIAYTHVDGQEVSTALLPTTSTNKYFETLVTKSGTSYAYAASTLKEAIDNHKRAVESLAPSQELLVGYKDNQHDKTEKDNGLDRLLGLSSRSMAKN